MDLLPYKIPENRFLTLLIDITMNIIIGIKFMTPNNRYNVETESIMNNTINVYEAIRHLIHLDLIKE